MGNPPKHRAFCFTHNNYTEHDVSNYKKPERLNWDGMVFGHEIGEKTGTPHLQGFVWTAEPRTLQQMKRKMPGAAVFIPGKKKGPDHHIIDDGKTGFGYCLKEHDPRYVLEGSFPTEEEFQAQCPAGHGARTDLLECKRKIDEGTFVDDLMGDDQHFESYARHSKFFAQYQSYKRRRTQFSPPEVIVYCGKTGNNKTRRAWEKEEYGSDFWAWNPGMGEWFDGYSGQKAVLFDEYRGNFKYGFLLSILDGYPMQVQVKCGMVHWSPERIYITSPTPPQEWYPNLAADDKIQQLIRRITTVHHI